MHYNIVIVSDEGYIQHAAVMLLSLFDHNKGKDFHVYLLTNGITVSTESRLREICLRANASLIVINPEEVLGDCLGINLKKLPIDQWTTMMYYKLFIPLVLPQTEDRCLFLDVDMIINDDIELLYQWNLHGSAIAAAEDIPDCIKTKERLHMEQADKYINSGVMVCDLNAWRQMEKEHPIFDFVLSVAHRIINEQDVIALYFKGKLEFLPIRWNMTTFYFAWKPKIFAEYIGELPDAKRHPAIIHFAAPIKPWFRDSQHPYRKLYRKYLALTPWANEWKFPIYEQLTPHQRFNRHIKNLINRFGFPLEDGFTPPVR